MNILYMNDFQMWRDANKRICFSSAACNYSGFGSLCLQTILKETTLRFQGGIIFAGWWLLYSIPAGYEHYGSKGQQCCSVAD